MLLNKQVIKERDGTSRKVRALWVQQITIHPHVIHSPTEIGAGYYMRHFVDHTQIYTYFASSNGYASAEFDERTRKSI